MQATLEDIRRNLQKGLYRFRDQVLLGVVVRILHELGWNVWSPQEVCPQYSPTRRDEALRVDLALLAETEPCVLIGVEDFGATQSRLDAAEQKLSKISRHTKTPLGLITDGQNWRMYVSQSRGTLAENRFETLDLLASPSQYAEEWLIAFLSKSSIRQGSAMELAKQHAKKSVVMRRCLAMAQKMSQTSRHSTMTEILIQLVEAQGYTLRRDEAVEFLRTKGESESPKRIKIPSKRTQKLKPSPSSVPDPDRAMESGVRHLNPGGPIDLRFTTLESARIGSEEARKWVSLFDTAIRIALDRRLTVHELERITTAEFRKGKQTDERFHHVEGTDFSVESLDFTSCFQNTYLICRQINLELTARFRWRIREGAAYPGQEGVLHWTPND